MFRKLHLFVSLLIFVFSINAIGETKENFFYHKQNYGSESQFNGLNVFLNVGYVVSGRFTTPYIFDDIDYSDNFSTVITSFSNQKDAYHESGGWSRFSEEFNPFDGSGRFLPNFGLHFLGEGMLSRKLEEQYRMKGYSYPRTAAIATVVAGQLMNETVEVDMPWYDPMDSMADIYWNIAGFVAFSYDGFAKLFSNDLVNLYYWPGQPVIDVNDGAMYNQGESYLVRAGRGDWKLAFGMGIPVNGLGASYTTNDADYYTVLLGTDMALPRENWIQPEQRVGEVSRDVIIDLAIPSLQFHWDRSGSLMASMIIGVTNKQCDDGTRVIDVGGGKGCVDPTAKRVNRTHFNLNVYPFKVGSLMLGGYVIASDAGASSIGITFNYPPVSVGRRFD